MPRFPSPVDPPSVSPWRRLALLAAVLFAGAFLAAPSLAAPSLAMGARAALDEGPVLRWVPLAAAPDAKLVGVRSAAGVHPAQRANGGAWALVPRSEAQAELTPEWWSKGVNPVQEPVVAFEVTEDRIEVRFGAELFTTYHFRDGARPYFHPLNAPGGVPLTRSWPMQEGPDEQQDHPHHRSLWFAFGDVDGHDLWAEQGGHGSIRHLESTAPVAGPVFGEFQVRDAWTAADGTVLCTDQRRYRFFPLGDRRAIDVEVHLVAGERPVRFGDTKEGMMALRVTPTMRVDGPVGQGAIQNSAGDRDAAAWGKRAAWCDVHGPVRGQRWGIAIFDHPANLRHPTWWHVRTYGLFAANPFGIHDFERKPAGTGDHVLPAGERLSFRYRVLLHPGGTEEAGVAGDHERWVAQERAAGRAPAR